MLKKIFYIVLIIVGILGILNTIFIIPVSSSISIGTLLPAMGGVVLLAYGLIKMLRPGPIIPNKVLRIIVTVCVVIGILSFAVVETLIIASAVSSDEDKEANYVIVLGCGIFQNGSLTLTLKNRLDTAYDYLETHNDTICIVSGGQGGLEPRPEGEAMRDYLISKGLDENRILVEARSTSTEENIKFSIELMDKTYPHLDKTAAIVTSDFHIFRSVMIAKDKGLSAFGIPCPTPYYVIANCYMREYLAIIKTVLF